MSESNEEIDHLIEAEEGGYDHELGTSSEMTEHVLRDIYELKKAAHKSNSMLETLIGEHPMPLSTAASFLSSDSPRVIASPRVMNQDLANMKARLDALENFQSEIIRKMNSEFITILNRASDEISLLKIMVEEMNEKITLNIRKK